MKRHALILAALAAFATPAAGAIKYVRTSGSNANTGNSPAQAWATLSYAVTQASAGDVVYVGAGTYTDQVAPSKSGTAANPIRYVADPYGVRTGDPGAVVLQRAGNVMNLASDNYLTFTGFTVRSTNATADVIDVSACLGVVFEWCTVAGGRDGFDLDGGMVTISQCTINGTGDDGIDSTTGIAIITDTTVADVGAGDAGIRITNSTTGVVDSCVIRDGAPGVYLDGGYAGVVNSVITGASVQTAVRKVNAGDGGVLNTTIHDITGDGVHHTGGNMFIYNVIFSHIGEDCMDSDGGAITAANNVAWVFGSDRSEGFDSTEITADPKFVNAAGGNFRVQAGSPAINAGSTYPSYVINDDITGVARPIGAAWDIGAYEYGGGITPASVPYATTFATVGPEWHNALPGSDPDVGNFIGRYGLTGTTQSAATLHLYTTPGTTYTVTFDLLLIDTWDGHNATYGPDAFQVLTDGVPAFHETFSHHSFPAEQTYPHPADATGIWVWDAARDGRYDGVTFTFVATAGITEIMFVGDASEAIANESWALLDVEVIETPLVFVDVTAAAGFGYDTNTTMAEGSAIIWADMDSDGDLDAVVGGTSTHLLRYNAGTGVFSPILVGSFPRGTAIADLDSDGDADYFNVNNNTMKFAENFGGVPLDRGEAGVDGPTNAESVVALDIDLDADIDLVVFAGNGNWIARNMGPGYSGHNPIGFLDSIDAADGLNDAGDFGNGHFVSAADANADGHLDFFYHYNSGKLFLSDADGAYTENALGISVYTDESYKFGSSWGDYDNDGDFDLFAPDARPAQPGTLWRNASNATAFTNAAPAAGITSTAAMRGAAWGDYDNDGDLDLYVTTAAGGPNLLYTNNGDATFTLENLGAGLTGDFQDAVFVDYDADGDLDIALTRIDGDGKTVLLQNQTDNDNYLKVRLVGAHGVNTLGLGARIELWDQPQTTLLGTRHVGNARGFGGVEPIWAHFGGVNPAAAYALRVVWPGGREQVQEVTPQAASTTIGAATIDQMVTITAEPSGIRFVQWREVDPTE